MDVELRKKFDRLVVEAEKLFGGRPYQDYTFLLALSDHVAHFGLEHYSSSDNRVPERVIVDGRFGKTGWGQLLPHEFVHAWNGKYRRPAEMVVDDFQKPQRTKLLWVYEGLTQYYGVVLTTRCGLWTDEQFRDHLATIGEWAKNQRGRTWRPLEDTAVAAQLLYYARGDWASWRRGTDFYDEGTLLWLDADTLIRTQTKGKRSLDDFCRRFHAVDPKFPLVKPFTFDDLVADLNAVTPHDWKGFLEARVKGTGDAAPLQGITRGGWTLTYADHASDFQQANEDDAKTIDLSSSLGLSLRSEGQVSDVVHGKPAHAAGVGPGMKLVAVNTRRWTPQVLRDALADAKKAGKGKLSLLFENGDIFRTLEISYHDGERFPRLERVTESPDLIGDITRPLAPPAKK
jgi:predicted metalloprotease with PDZ domain